MVSPSANCDVRHFRSRLSQAVEYLPPAEGRGLSLGVPVFEASGVKSGTACKSAQRPS